MFNFLIVTQILFFFALLGFFLVRRHLLVLLISAELLLLAVNLNFLIASSFLDDILGQVFSLLILTLAASESAVGLSILLVFYRLRGTVFVNFIALLKG